MTIITIITEITIMFLVAVMAVILVTWVIWTPKLSQKPMIGLCVKFHPSSTPPSDRFWWGVLLVVPYIKKSPVKSSIRKSKNITELARSIENLMDKIMNYNGEENDPDMRVPSEENTNEANNQYQNTFIDYLNNTLEGNHIGDPGENVIDLSEDDSGLGNASGDKEAFDSIEDLLAESDGDEYMEPDFEVKSEKK